MPATFAISAQINLAPPDCDYAQLLLPRQVAILSPHVAEVVLTLETRPGKGRFAEGWKENHTRIEALIAEIAKTHKKVAVRPILYDAAARAAVRDGFCLRWDIPWRDFRGGPFYGYLYGLNSAANDIVFHLDSDIILGGDATGWFEEAGERLLAEPDLAAVAPLAGPPTADGTLRQDRPLGEDRLRREYLFDSMSTRVFMTTRSKLRALLDGSLLPPVRSLATALIDGNPFARLPEDIMSSSMRRRRLRRVDMAGPEGFWTLHPPYKSARFLERLPGILEDVESGSIPDSQRGYYDVNAGLYDFAAEHAALARRRWWMRLQSRFGQIGSRTAQ